VGNQPVTPIRTGEKWNSTKGRKNYSLRSLKKKDVLKKRKWRRVGGRKK